MEIIVNGERMIAPDGSTVSELLEQQGLGRSPCAVEVNRQLVPKAEHSAHRLADQDRVEIVTLVGGG